MGIAPRKGISLKQLALEAYGAEWLRDRGEFQAVLKEVEAARRNVHFAQWLGNPSCDWLYVDGDVEVPGDLLVDASVVVGGSLRVAGIYDDYRAGMGHALVMGDLEAEHVLTWCDLGVLGDLKARGLVYACYNDHVVELSGSFEARAFVINDKSCSFDSKGMRGELYGNDYSGEGGRHSLQVFEAEIMFEALEPTRSASGFEVDYDRPLPSFQTCQQRLWDGDTVFRTVPAGPELVEWVAAALNLDEQEQSEELRALQGKDPLVDRIVEFRLSPEPEPEAHVPPTRAEIEATLLGDDEWERGQLLEHHDVLLPSDFEALCADEASDTRRKCAEAIRGQALGKRKSILTEGERHRLAETLAVDPDSYVRAEAMGSLPTASQERIGMEALRAAGRGDPGGKENKGVRYVLRHLAWFTSSEPLQLALFDSDHPGLMADLASNPFLAPRTQRRIQGLLPGIEAADSESDGASDHRMAIAFMLDNPATDPEVVRELAIATLGHQGRSSILLSWRTSAPMTSELVDILRGAVDEDMRYEWPEMVLRAPDASRSQLAEALTQRTQQDRDEEQQAWIKSLEPLGDADFFKALKGCDDEDISRSPAAHRSRSVPDDGIEG